MDCLFKTLVIIILGSSFHNIIAANKFEDSPSDEKTEGAHYCKELLIFGNNDNLSIDETLSFISPRLKPNTFVFIPKVSIKTNLLYLVGVLPDFEYYTPIPNLEAEWHITSCWALVGTGAYAKWGTGKGRMFGISSWSLEPRFWFEGINFIDSYYLGLYGMAGDFDKKGYGVDPIYNNRTGEFWGGGLSMGALVLFNERWGMEVGFRAGVRSTKTDLYCDKSPDYFRDETYTKTKFNLQGLKISIVYRFGINLKLQP